MFHLVLCGKRGPGCFLQGKLRQKRKGSLSLLPTACLCNQKQQVSYDCTEPGPLPPTLGTPCVWGWCGFIEPLGFCPEAGPLRLSEAWVCPRVTPGEGVAGNKEPIQFWVGGGWGGAGPGLRDCWECVRRLTDTWSQT